MCTVTDQVLRPRQIDDGWTNGTVTDVTNPTQARCGIPITTIHTEGNFWPSS